MIQSKIILKKHILNAIKVESKALILPFPGRLIDEQPRRAFITPPPPDRMATNDCGCRSMTKLFQRQPSLVGGGVTLRPLQFLAVYLLNIMKFMMMMMITS